MIDEYEPEESAGQENGPAFTLGVIFIVLIFLTICSLGLKFFSRLVAPGQTPTQVVPVAVVPTNIPTVGTVNTFSSYLPIILDESSSLSASVSEQIWIVTNITNLGYELAGKRYDLATFMRLASQDTVEAYCIDNGLDAPVIGAQYRLNAEGVFIPLDNSHPIQRFLKIQ